MTLPIVKSFTPAAWYWLATDGRVYSSATGAITNAKDKNYTSWLAEGFYPTAWPLDTTGAQTVEALNDVLSNLGVLLTPTGLIAYAEQKQMTVLAAMTVSYQLKDGSATLNTKCDPLSITFSNSLASWVALNSAATPVPTRAYYNLDGSAHSVTPANLAEFLNYVGTRVQATFDAVAKVRSAITAASPTITSVADIDAFAWPTS